MTLYELIVCFLKSDLAVTSQCTQLGVDTDDNFLFNIVNVTNKHERVISLVFIDYYY